MNIGMAHRAFYSFHYKPDNWRAATVRNIGAIDGNKPAPDNDWETIKEGGDVAIKKWIADQLKGRSCKSCTRWDQHGRPQMDQLRDHQIVG